jgi:hypothetical protein
MKKKNSMPAGWDHGVCQHQRIDSEKKSKYMAALRQADPCCSPLLEKRE